ncbi:MAG: hypothetical protein OSB46_00900 [Alphaproteobacteria bacterium]|nr:hypothetical protein [Alphaproteobacteria bacterium]
MTPEVEVISRNIDTLLEQMDVDADGGCIIFDGDPEQLRLNESSVRLRHAKTNSIRNF